MDKLLALQLKIAPEVLLIIVNRYQVLRAIHYLQPIGRRALANYLHLPERKVRSEIDFLKEQILVEIDSDGMRVSPDGEQLLWELAEYIREIQGLNTLENLITDRFPVKEVIVVPGDADQDEYVKKDLARVTANYLQNKLRDGDVLAVTGGTTLAEVAGALTAPTTRRNIMVVPARGGLGEEVEIQANTVAANIAKGLGAGYRLLHVPDDLQVETMHSIVNEPKIKEVLDLLHQADMVLHGIGSAEEMARRRGMSPEKITRLTADGAVGEAFGYYFTEDGRLIHSTSSVGLQLSELNSLRTVVAVVGGKSKGLAVKSVLTNSPRDMLIIDEGAARVIVGKADSAS